MRLHTVLTRISARGGHLKRKWLILIAVTIGQFMTMLDGTIINVAIPHLQTAFGADIQAVQWAVTVYMLTQAAFLPTAPYLIARFGGKQAYIWTMVAFLAGSVLCGLAWNLPSLVFFRFVQGIGGGILLPLVMPLIYQTFSAEERPVAVSAMGIPLMIAPALGPLLGGFLLTYLGWQAAFFINIPAGIISILIARRVLPDSGKEPMPSFDLAGFVTSAAGAAALLYGVTEVTGSNTDAGLVAVCAAIVLLTAFVVIELRKVRQGRQPLLDLRHFGERGYTFSNITNVCIGGSRFGVQFILPIYLQSLRGRTPIEAGEIMMTMALTTMVTLPFVGRLAKRIGPRPMVMLGLVMFATVALLMTTQTLTTPLWTIVAILVLQGIAYAFLQQTPVLAMRRIENEEQKAVAHGSTLITLLHSTAAPLGIALLSSIVQSRSEVYRGQLAGSGLDGGLLGHLGQLSTLFGMYDALRVAALLLATAFLAVCFVPARIKVSVLQLSPEK